VNYWAFDTCYIIKHLFTETSGKQRVLCPLDHRFPLGQQRRYKTRCFPRSQ
jgi:hypothetical protein